jgi:phage-related protein (TIGR01555 family)
MQLEYVVGASRIPKSRLFGNQSGVLGASAVDGDIRNHYDAIKAFQLNDLDHKVKRVSRLKAIADGLPTEGWDVAWKPLWQMAAIEQSQIAANFAQADTAYIMAGVLHPEEVAESRFGGDGINYDDIVLDQGLREEKEKEEIKLEEEMRKSAQLTEGPKDQGEG